MVLKVSDLGITKSANPPKRRRRGDRFVADKSNEYPVNDQKVKHSHKGDEEYKPEQDLEKQYQKNKRDAVAKLNHAKKEAQGLDSSKSFEKHELLLPIEPSIIKKASDKSCAEFKDNPDYLKYLSLRGNLRGLMNFIIKRSSRGVFDTSKDELISSVNFSNESVMRNTLSKLSKAGFINVMFTRGRTERTILINPSISEFVSNG